MPKEQQTKKFKPSALSASLLALGFALAAGSPAAVASGSSSGIKNTLDSGLKIQALDTRWRESFAPLALDWSQRGIIARRHEVRYASQLHQLAVSMVRQMPSRASLLLKDQMPDNIACQIDIDRYVQGAEAHMAAMDLEALYDHGLKTRSDFIRKLHQGYQRSGELALAMDQLIGRSSDLFDAELFDLIDRVNALDLHHMPESQSRARLIRENQLLQALRERTATLNGWHLSLAESAMQGRLTLRDQLSMILLAEADSVKTGRASSSLDQVVDRYSFGGDLFEHSGALTRLVDFANLTLQHPLLGTIASHEKFSQNLHLLTSAADYSSMVRSLTIPALQRGGDAVNQAISLENREIASCAGQIEVIMAQIADFSRLLDQSLLEQDFLAAQNTSMSSERAARRNLISQINSNSSQPNRRVSRREIEKIRVFMLNQKLNELRNNGYLQILLEGISGIPMNWVEPKLFEILLNYRPSDFREINTLRRNIEENPPSPQTAFYLDLIDQAVKDTMTEATRFGLTVSLAAYDLLIQDPAKVPLTDALSAMRSGAGHQKVMYYAGQGFDALGNAELALASAYASIFEDPAHKTWVNARDAITSMVDNTDEYGLSWNAEEDIALPLSSGERNTPRSAVFWCLDRANTKTALGGTPDAVSGLFMLYDNPRHLVTKMTGYKTSTANSNPFAHIGRPVSYHQNDDQIYPLYYEGQMIRAIAFPVGGNDAESAAQVVSYEGMTPEQIDAEQERLMENLPEGAVMHVYAESMRPTTYTYRDLEGNLRYGFRFDGEAGYEWQRFTCRTDQR